MASLRSIPLFHVEKSYAIFIYNHSKCPSLQTFQGLGSVQRVVTGPAMSTQPQNRYLHHDL